MDWFFSILHVLLTTLIVTVMIIASLSYIFFWYEEANSPRFAATPFKRALPLLARGTIHSLLSQVLVWLTYPFSLLVEKRLATATRTCSLPPVLLVHGLYHNSSAWCCYIYWLKKAGFSNVHTYSYSSFNTDFTVARHGLDQAIRQLRVTHPDQPPVLIGHSLGGLLIRSWYNHSCNNAPSSASAKSPAAGIITLGTPHQGSKLAALAIGTLGRSIRFRSPLLQQIEAEECPPAIPCYSLYSRFDNMVLPQAGLHITTEGWLSVATPNVSHIAMLYHAKTAQLAIAKAHEIVQTQ